MRVIDGSLIEQHVPVPSLRQSARHWPLRRMRACACLCLSGCILQEIPDLAGEAHPENWIMCNSAHIQCGAIFNTGWRHLVKIMIQERAEMFHGRRPLACGAVLPASSVTRRGDALLF